MSECNHPRTVSVLIEGMPLGVLSAKDPIWLQPTVAVHRCLYCGRVRQVDESFEDGRVIVTRLEART